VWPPAVLERRDLWYFSQEKLEGIVVHRQQAEKNERSVIIDGSKQENA
jgi:hypothetical protein